MCGIAGVFAFNEVGKDVFSKVKEANLALSKRGPDYAGFFEKASVSLTHARLSIIDISPEGNQPRHDEMGRYTIVFNGEIFNYKELRAELELEGTKFYSQSDTEVLLKSYIKWGVSVFNRLNGFFAFAIYDAQEDELIICRDRYGIKPLFIHQNENYFAFASELKALYKLGVNKEIDEVSLLQYLHLNYIPAPQTIVKNVTKFPIGHYAILNKNGVTVNSYYEIPAFNPKKKVLTYEKAQEKLHELLEDAVKQRLVSDVPLGAFLSGGIDSSVIVALASKYVSQLNTFSIGYKDEPFFDETSYAKLVANQYKTNHTVFSLTNDDLLENVFGVLDYLDEPFADSSALAVFILSKLTRQHVKVALSGDGADELFAGYNKYKGALKANQKSLINNTVTSLHPLWEALPKSRNNPLGNLVRQLHRFSEGNKLSETERYWKWAGFAYGNESFSLLSNKMKAKVVMSDYENRKANITKHLEYDKSVNGILRADMELVLQNDMLVKVDMMSMANSLEVRVPFLDYRVVDFAFSLPETYKINAQMKKRIVQDAFRPLLPTELYNRPKHGFEVPLLKWFRNELKSYISDDLLEDKFVEAQGIFDVQETRKLKQKLFSSNPEDSHARIWGLIVFQYWWKKYLGELCV